MKKFFYIIFAFIYLFSNLEGAQVYSKYMQEIKSGVSRTLEKRHKMSLIGEGTGAMHCVEMLALSFQIDHLLLKDDARKIIVDCVNEFTMKINNHKKIRPYLKTYPFEGAEVTIFIYDKGDDINDPDICVVDYRDKVITYYTNDPENKLLYKQKIHEPFEEAVQILKSQGNQYQQISTKGI